MATDDDLHNTIDLHLAVMGKALETGDMEVIGPMTENLVATVLDVYMAHEIAALYVAAVIEAAGTKIMLANADAALKLKDQS